jgi:hypothetical protein
MLLDKMIVSILLILSLFFSMVNGYALTNTAKKCVDYSYVDTKNAKQSSSVCYKLVSDYHEDPKHMGNYTYPYLTTYTYTYYKKSTRTATTRLRGTDTKGTTVVLGQEGYIDYGVDGVYNKHRVRLQKSFLKIPSVAQCKSFDICITRTPSKKAIDSYTFDCTNLPYGRKSTVCEPIKPLFFPFTFDLLK